MNKNEIEEIEIMMKRIRVLTFAIEQSAKTNGNNESIIDQLNTASDFIYKTLLNLMNRRDNESDQDKLKLFNNKIMEIHDYLETLVCIKIDLGA